MFFLKLLIMTKTHLPPLKCHTLNNFRQEEAIASSKYYGNISMLLFRLIKV
jgi:hypothetical protein